MHRSTIAIGGSVEFDKGRRAVARWHAGDRFATSTLRSTLATEPVVAGLLILLGLAASWSATYLLGGAGRVVPHFYYVPILFAAVRFGPVAAVIVAVASGVLAGPLTHLDVAAQSAQETSRWLTRAGFFATVGIAMAALVRPSLPSLSDEVRHRRDARTLHRALEAGELTLRYQPIVLMRTGGLYGVEALVRWNHPEHGELVPAEFLHAAEASGAIREIDRFVLAEAARQAVHWSELAGRAGTPPPCVTVNMSPSDLESAELIADVRDTLDETGVDPRQICIEVTESTLVGDYDVSVARLAGLKTLGVRLAIDDFGTGYSSLNSLHRFPVDVLKVDRAFLRTLGRDPAASGLLGGLVLFARSLDLTLIAEGVETTEQRDRLATHGYEIAQGYLYAKPLLPDEIDDLVTGATVFEHVETAGHVHAATPAVAHDGHATERRT